MKRNAFKAIALILALLLLSASLSACAPLMMRFTKEEERPMKLYEAVMKGMDDVKSATILTTIKLQAVISEAKITATVKQTEQALDKKGELLHRSEVKGTTKIDGETTTTVSLSGYQDGKMYFASGEIEDTYTNQLSAPISEQEYRDHQLYLAEHIGLDLDFTAEECKTMTCEQLKEDKKWIGTYTDFEGSFLRRAIDSLDGMEALFCEEYKIVDLSMSVIADKALIPIRIELEFEFAAISDEADEALPSLSIVIEVSDVNETEIEKEDLKDFDEVDDLRVLDLVDVWVDNHAAKEEGSFSSTSDIETTIFNQTHKQQQKIDLSFKEGQNGFSYTIKQEQDGSEYVLSYQDGKQTAKYLSSGEELSSTSEIIQEATAKYQLTTLLTPTELVTSEVSDVKVEEKNGQTAYTLQMEDPVTLKKQLQDLFGNDSTDLSLSAVYTLYVKDGALVKYTCEMDATFKYEGINSSYDISITATYS